MAMYIKFEENDVTRGLPPMHDYFHRFLLDKLEKVARISYDKHDFLIQSP